MQSVNHFKYTAFYGSTLQSVSRTSPGFVRAGYFTRFDTHMVMSRLQFLIIAPSNSTLHMYITEQVTLLLPLTLLPCSLLSVAPSLCPFHFVGSTTMSLQSRLSRRIENARKRDTKKFDAFPREGAMPHLWSICRIWSNGTISPFLELPPVFLGLLQRSNFVFRPCIIFICSRPNDDQHTG